MSKLRTLPKTVYVAIDDSILLADADFESFEDGQPLGVYELKSKARVRKSFELVAQRKKRRKAKKSKRAKRSRK